MKTMATKNYDHGDQQFGVSNQLAPKKYILILSPNITVGNLGGAPRIGGGRDMGDRRRRSGKQKF